MEELLELGVIGHLHRQAVLFDLDELFALVDAALVQDRVDAEPCERDIELASESGVSIARLRVAPTARRSSQ